MTESFKPLAADRPSGTTIGRPAPCEGTAYQPASR